MSQPLSWRSVSHEIPRRSNPPTDESSEGAPDAEADDDANQQSPAHEEDPESWAERCSVSVASLLHAKAPFTRRAAQADGYSGQILPFGLRIQEEVQRKPNSNNK